jgi:hypothetical protein
MQQTNTKTLSLAFPGNLLAFFVATTQADHKLDDQTIQTDNTIRAQIIIPLSTTNNCRKRPSRTQHCLLRWN